MKKNLLLITLPVFASLASTASAVVLAQYGFENSYAASTVDTGLDASSVSAGSGVSPNPPVFSGTSAVGNRSLAVQGLTETSSADAISTNDYIEFTLTPDGGYTMDLEDITVYLQRSNDPGSATTVFARSSLDSFGSTIDTLSSIPVSPSGFANYSIDLTGSAYQDLTESVTFRLYAFGGNNSSSSLRFDDLTVNGTAAIPEPATSAILLMGVAAGFALVRRRRQS